MALILAVLLGGPAYRFPEDEERDVTRHVELEIELGGTDEAISYVMMSAPFLSFQRIAADEDATRTAQVESDHAVVTQTAHRAHVTGTYDEEPYDFTFEYPGEPPQEAGLQQTLWAIFAEEQRFTLTPRGVWTHVKDDEDAMGEALNYLLNPHVRWPETREAREGDEWEECFDGTKRDRDSQGIYRYVQRSRWARTEEGVAVLDWSLEAQMDKGEGHRQQVASVQARDENTVTGRGTVRFDIERGEIVGSESEGRVRGYYRGPAEGVEGEMELEMIFRVRSREEAR